MYYSRRRKIITHTCTKILKILKTASRTSTIDNGRLSPYFIPSKNVCGKGKTRRFIHSFLLSLASSTVCFVEIFTEIEVEIEIEIERSNQIIGIFRKYVDNCCFETAECEWRAWRATNDGDCCRWVPTRSCIINGYNNETRLHQ